jgi:hypothetical protein
MSKKTISYKTILLSNMKLFKFLRLKIIIIQKSMIDYKKIIDN